MEHTADSAPQPTALERLHDWWQRLASRVRPARGDSAADRARSRLVTQLQELFEDCRTQRGGEFSARSRAEKIAAIYRAADPAQRAIILSLITHAFAPDRSELDRTVGAMQSATSDCESSRAEAQLRIALDAPRARFLTQFNLLPDGVKFLVDLRYDLLGLLPQEPALEVLHVEFDSLLASLVRPRISGTRAYQLAIAGADTRKADGTRSGAPDRIMERFAQPPRHGPPLLRVFPSAHAE
jgi:malonyl-CoA decarboxylase